MNLRNPLLGGIVAWVSFSQPSLAEVSVSDIAPVWAGHPTRFSLLSRGDVQFVAFYDAARAMTLGKRSLPDGAWTFKKLDSTLKWDSHNAVTIATDREGYLHISGNMHNIPLVYFRSSKPLDIDSVEAVHQMTGTRESKVTYPVFLKGKDDALVFNYRDGSSGNGSTLYNIYDEATKTWHRLIDTPMFDGEGKMNSYPQAPKKGPDGFYHMTWLWRDTPMSETNHDLSYARSRDLVTWETADGEPLRLPLTLGSSGTIVDPIPVKGGIINSSGKVGFDGSGNVVISYHKYDAAGNTQLYFARFENDAWKFYQATDWKYRWEFSGGGSLSFEISHGALEAKNGQLSIQVSHIKEGSGMYRVDPASLKLTEKLKSDNAMPSAFAKVTSQFPGMKINWATDLGESGDGKIYQLRWETLPQNRDRPRPQPWPEPSMLQVIGLPK